MILIFSSRVFTGKQLFIKTLETKSSDFETNQCFCAPGLGWTVSQQFNASVDVCFSCYKHDGSMERHSF